MAFAALALLLALVARLIDWRGLLVLLAFAALCRFARRPAPRVVTIAAHVLLLAICAALFLHVLPGFYNPRVITDAVLGPDAEPYTKYLNFDKGAVGLCLLGLYAPELPAIDEGRQHVRPFVWRFALMVVIAMAVALAVRYVRWDPKLPSWWAVWLWSMAFLTALPEEALFRGWLQTMFARWLGSRRFGTSIAIAVAGVIFGFAHVGGGPAYVVLATVAGIGYGWIYASTRSIGAAILAHTGLNTLHFLLFTYPAIRVLNAPWAY